MPHCTRTKQDVSSRIADMFRLAERDYGMDLKRLELLSGMTYETLLAYRNGAAMPLHAFVQIAPYVADELLSMCLAPAHKHVGSDEKEPGGLDTLGREAAGFICEKLEAEADGHIDHIETARLKQRANRMAAVARSAAA